MPGPWQHYIPGLLRRYFGIKPRSGKPTDIWRFSQAAVSEIVRIKDTAAEDYFYSPQPQCSEDTLDSIIERHETTLDRMLRNLRNVSPGSAVNAESASSVVTHLSFRTRHTRETFHRGMETIACEAGNVYGKEGTIKRMMGLDRTAPTEIFANALRSAMADIRAIGLIPEFIPDSLLENMLFQYAREEHAEHLSDVSATLIRALAALTPNLAGMIRTAHNAAMAKQFSSGSPAWQYLRSLSWRIEAAPTDGAVLPDCVSISISADGTSRPLILASHDDMKAVVMPLSSKQLLVGTVDGAGGFNAANYNELAAACSHAYFEAAENKEVFRELTKVIGTNSTQVVDQLAIDALAEQLQASAAVLIYEPEDQSPSSEQVTYPVAFDGAPESLPMETVAARVKDIVDALATRTPLNRLDGVTFARDYVQAVYLVDRGHEQLHAEHASLEGAGKAILVFREGVAKGRVVMPLATAYTLLNSPTQGMNGARYALTFVLALVSAIELTDEAVPELLGRPVENPFESWLYQYVHGALDIYLAARLSAQEGDSTELMNHYRDLMEAQMRSATNAVIAAKAAYRESGDINVVSDTALRACGCILDAAARLLGTAHAFGLPPIEPAGALTELVAATGLQQWLRTFSEDLQSLYERFGARSTVADRYRFNRHVDRLLWSFGMAIWLLPNGGWWVQVFSSR